MKKIPLLHLISSSFFGGPEKQIIEHFKIIDKTKYQPFLATFLENDLLNEMKEKSEEAGIFTITINSKKLVYLPLSIVYLIINLHKFKIKLLCVHGYKSVVLGYLAGSFLKIPVLAFSRGYTTENRKVAAYEWVERIILKKVAGIISVSYGQKRKLDDFKVTYKRLWVVHNAVNLVSQDNTKGFKEKLCKDNSIPFNSLIAVTAGRLSPEKGHSILIDAMKKISPEYNIHLLVCGDGQCRNELVTKTFEYGLGNIVHFLGFKKNINAIFSCMDFFILPSFTEGLPNVILESFAHKKCVIATNVGGVSEVVQHNINGFLVPSGDPVAMSEAIQKIAIDKNLRILMGGNGFVHVRNSFSFNEQNQKLQRIYDELFMIKHQLRY